MKTKYDWSNVPDWVNWIAGDSDGEVFGFKEMPTSFDEFMWYGKNSIFLKDLKICEHWKNSLEKRPNEI